MVTCPNFDILLAVSDLHLSTRPFGLFHQSEELKGMAAWAAAQAKQQRIVVVFNGDTFDFLVERSQETVITSGAAELVGKMGEAIWPSLKDLVAAGCHVVFTIGNHDAELALTEVQDAILFKIDPKKTGRVHFAVDGTGFLCELGGVRCYLEHGNRVDRLNHIDFGGLAEINRAIKLGLEVPKWAASVGTLLVKRVLNGLDLPFVERLAADTLSIARIALSVDRGFVLRHLDEAAIAYVQGTANWSVKRSQGISVLASNQVRAPLQALLEDVLVPLPEPGASEPSAGLAVLRGEELPGCLDAAGANLLGPFGLLYPSLRTALKASLAPLEPRLTAAADAGARDFQKTRVQPSVLVHGHTHQPRCCELPNDARYYNLGTWADVVELPKVALESDEAFARIDTLLRERDPANFTQRAVSEGWLHRQAPALLVDSTDHLGRIVAFRNGQPVQP